MATTNDVKTLSVPANADLRTHQFKFGVVNNVGKVALLAALGGRVDGVIGNKPNTDETTELQVGGLKLKVITGAAPIAAGAEVASTAAGLAITAVSTNFVAGIAVKAAAAGEMVEILPRGYFKP